METTQKPQTSPKDFFINLGVIVLTYFIVGNMLSLLFDTIDFAFPASINAGNYIPDISFSLAALIVGFPIVFVLSWVLSRDEKVEPFKHELPVRRWLGYLTLFIAGVVVLGDLIALLSTFLRGEDITTAFVLKVLSVFVVAGFVLGYYLVDLRYKGTLPLKKWLAVKATVLVVLALGCGFYVFGSPATQRAMRFDSERIGSLQNIQYQVLDFWQNKKTVPASLVDLGDEIRGVTIPRDPRTDASYGYEKLSATSFKLCATFEREGGKNTETVKTIPVPAGTIGVSDYWGHEAGLVCFERTIDPARYTVNAKNI